MLARLLANPSGTVHSRHQWCIGEILKANVLDMYSFQNVTLTTAIFVLWYVCAYNDVLDNHPGWKLCSRNPIRFYSTCCTHARVASIYGLKTTSLLNQISHKSLWHWLQLGFLASTAGDVLLEDGIIDDDYTTVVSVNSVKFCLWDSELIVDLTIFILDSPYSNYLTRRFVLVAITKISAWNTTSASEQDRIAELLAKFTTGGGGVCQSFHSWRHAGRRSWANARARAESNCHGRRYVNRSTARALGKLQSESIFLFQNEALMG